MKIAFISLMGGASWGGSEALWHKTAELALEQGHQVFASVYRWETIHDKINELMGKGATINFRNRYDPSLPFLGKLNSYIKCNLFKSSSEYRDLWKFRPDTIFINQGNNFDLLVHHYKLFEEVIRNKIPYSIICHNHPQYSAIPDKNIYPRGKEVFLKAKYVFFVSNRQKLLTERSLCTKLNNAVFSWNPLNLKEMRLLDWPVEKTIQFAVVASLDSNKGHDTLFDVLSQKEWQDREWQLNVYGKGVGKDYLHDLAKFFNIADKITFYGYVNNIAEVWKKNHILLIPSAGEGLPISLCEAMICGRPAVVTDVGGNTEMIRENETGFIAPAPTVSSFAEALEKAWRNRDEWEEMGKKAWEFISDKIKFNPHAQLLNLILKANAFQGKN